MNKINRSSPVPTAEEVFNTVSWIDADSHLQVSIANVVRMRNDQLVLLRALLHVRRIAVASPETCAKEIADYLEQMSYCDYILLPEEPA